LALIRVFAITANHWRVFIRANTSGLGAGNLFRLAGIGGETGRISFTLIRVFAITTNHWRIFIQISVLMSANTSFLGAGDLGIFQLTDVSLDFIENTYLPALDIAWPVRKRVACALERCLVAVRRQACSFSRLAFRANGQETAWGNICDTLGKDQFFRARAHLFSRTPSCRLGIAAAKLGSACLITVASIAVFTSGTRLAKTLASWWKFDHDLLFV
jgi:hypothetical protein